MKRTTRSALLATACVAALTMVALSLPAGAQQFAAPLTIAKVVEGDAPADAAFVITLTCSSAIITDGLGGPAVAEYTFEWGSEGGEQTVGFVDAGECTVTETGNGGAEETAYACEATSEGPVCHPPNADYAGIDILEEGQVATITVTNVFSATGVIDDPVEPVPAPAAVAQPRFTG